MTLKKRKTPRTETSVAPDTTVEETVVSESSATSSTTKPITVPEVSALSATALDGRLLICDACGKVIETGSATVYPSHVYCSTCARLGIVERVEVPLPRPKNEGDVCSSTEGRRSANVRDEFAPALKVDAVERKLWLEVYTGEYLRQVPRLGDHEESAERASKCADAAIAGLRKHDEVQKEAARAQDEAASLPANKRGRLVGPAELIGSPLPFGLGAGHLADLDYVDEVSAAISAQMAGFDKQLQELKGSFEKRLEAIESENRVARVEQAALSVARAVRGKRKR